MTERRSQSSFEYDHRRRAGYTDYDILMIMLANRAYSSFDKYPFDKISLRPELDKYYKDIDPDKITMSPTSKHMMCLPTIISNNSPQNKYRQPQQPQSQQQQQVQNQSFNENLKYSEQPLEEVQVNNTNNNHIIGKYAKKLPQELKRKILETVKRQGKELKQSITTNDILRERVHSIRHDPSFQFHNQQHSNNKNNHHPQQITTTMKDKEERLNDILKSGKERESKLQTVQHRKYQLELVEKERVYLDHLEREKRRQTIDQQVNRNERIDQYLALLERRKQDSLQLTKVVLLVKFIHQLDNSLVEYRSGLGTRYEIPLPKINYSQIQSLTFLRHKQRVLKQSYAKLYSSNSIRSKYVKFIVIHVIHRRLSNSKYVIRMIWKVKRKQIASKIIRDSLTNWLTVEVLFKEVKRFQFRVVLIQQKIRQYLHRRSCIMQLLCLQFAKEERLKNKLKDDYIVSHTSDQLRRKTRQQQRNKRVVHFQDEEIDAVISMRRRASMPHGYNLIPHDIRYNILLQDYITRKKEFVKRLQEREYILQWEENRRVEELNYAIVNSSEDSSGPEKPKLQPKIIRVHGRFKCLMSRSRVKKLIAKSEVVMQQRIKKMEFGMYGRHSRSDNSSLISSNSSTMK